MTSKNSASAIDREVRRDRRGRDQRRGRCTSRPSASAAPDEQHDRATASRARRSRRVKASTTISASPPRPTTSSGESAIQRAHASWCALVAGSAFGLAGSSSPASGARSSMPRRSGLSSLAVSLAVYSRVIDVDGAVHPRQERRRIQADPEDRAATSGASAIALARREVGQALVLGLVERAQNILSTACSM